ncbi:MAG: hypothetical protein WCK42_04810, partial [Myxococcaceae bacterium]
PPGEVYHNYKLLNGSIVTRQLYASEILGIIEEEEPQYDISYPIWQIKFYKLHFILAQNDFCDAIGTRYLAKLLAHFWPGTKEFFELSENERYWLDLILKDTQIRKPSLFEHARIEARNMIRHKYKKST